MKAIYLIKYGNSDTAFEIKGTPIPKAGKGEVVIKVACFGLNFADVVARRGLYPDAPKNPAILGYDVAGIVHEIGAGVENLKVGQRVTAMTRFGGYAEYAKTYDTAVAVIPASMDFATATTLGAQGCTAYHCAFETVMLHEGDRVLIHAAAGGVGALLVQMAKHKKCFVYGTASTSKMDYLKQIGVDVAIDYMKEDFYEVIKSSSEQLDMSNEQNIRSSTLTAQSSKPIDVVFDSLGGQTFKKSFKLLNSDGRIVTFGAAEQINGNKTSKFSGLKLAWGFGIFSPIQLLMTSRAIIGVNMLKIADNRPHIINRCLNGIIQLTDAGIITPKIAKIFTADKIAEAHDFLESRQSIGKVVVRW